MQVLNFKKSDLIAFGNKVTLFLSARGCRPFGGRKRPEHPATARGHTPFQTPVDRKAFYTFLSTKKAWLICLWIVLVMLGGCSREPQQKPGPPPPVVGVSVVFKEKDLVEPLKKAMEELAKKEKVQLIWKQSDQISQHKEDFDQLLERKVDCIVVQFADRQEAQELTRKAAEKDIRLLGLGTLPLGVLLDGFVGIDTFRVGEQQGQFLVEELKDKPEARVLIIRTDPANQAEAEIIEGNKNVLGSKPQIQVSERTMPASDVAGNLQLLWQELGGVDGIITHEPETTTAILNSLAGQPFTATTIGLGANKELAAAIAAGAHDAELDIVPETMGRYAFQAAVNLAKNGQWDFEKQEASGAYEVPVKYVPARVITKDNLYLLEQRYGKIEGQRSEQQPQQSEGQQSGQESQNSQSQGQGGQGSKQQPKSKVKIKVKGGKTMEIEVPGEIESVQIEGGADQEQQGQGGQGGQSEQGGQGGGGGQ